MLAAELRVNDPARRQARAGRGRKSEVVPAQAVGQAGRSAAVMTTKLFEEATAVFRSVLVEVPKRLTCQDNVLLAASNWWR